MKILRLGFSPCPNDTFIFGALATGKLDVANCTLEVIHEDVETLNTLARDGILDFTKISVHAFGLVAEHYSLLHSGAALGRGCGPLVVAREPHVGVGNRLRTGNLAVGGQLPDQPGHLSSPRRSHRRRMDGCSVRRRPEVVGRLKPVRGFHALRETKRPGAQL